MAYDYGSIDLGLRNPFRLEGLIVTAKGLVQMGMGGMLLYQSLGEVTANPVRGWIILLFGLFIIVLGIKSAFNGIYAALRYFVGRNHPTSLARNLSSAAADISKQEAAWVAYSAQTLESMLSARKNPTFVEPQGFLARLLYSVFPKLLFMPYPIRNLVQSLTEAWIRSFLLLVSYGLTAFVCLGGFVGELGNFIFPIATLILICALIRIWFRQSSFINRNAERFVASLGGKNIVSAIILGIIAPIASGLLIKLMLSVMSIEPVEIAKVIDGIGALRPEGFLILNIISALAVTAAIIIRILPRIAQTNPVTEVSELRTNWQNTVHPRDIFINLDNNIMARRRYREAPNRVYIQLNPQLEEQVNGKGTFSGEMIQEVQPRVLGETGQGKGAILWQLILLVASSLLSLVVTGVIMTLAGRVVDIGVLIESIKIKSMEQLLGAQELSTLMSILVESLRYLIFCIILTGLSNWLFNLNHLMISEIRFESLLIYFRCQGTFTETKISTGMSIHDSLRSENVQVRSSISPWMMVSRIVSSTFAGTGLRNLEHPRHILEMHTDKETMDAIQQDLAEFFDSRETLAGINNHRDVANAAMIQQINESAHRPLMMSLTDETKKGTGKGKTRKALTQDAPAKKPAPKKTAAKTTAVKEKPEKKAPKKTTPVKKAPARKTNAKADATKKTATTKASSTGAPKKSTKKTAANKASPSKTTVAKKSSATVKKASPKKKSSTEK